MNSYIAFVGLGVLLATQANGLQTVNGRIKITIGTTSGCGDTVRFIVALAPVYEQYRQHLDLEFVPWGRTEWHDNNTVTCQFGENDCWANRLHRCALNMLQGNQDAQMDYMLCEFTTPYPSYLQTSYYCANEAQLPIVDIDHCVSNRGDQLDRDAEEAGSALTAAIDFIPSIVFNDNIDIDLHTESLSKLESMVCFALAADPSTGVTNCPL